MSPLSSSVLAGTFLTVLAAAAGCSGKKAPARADGGARPDAGIADGGGDAAGPLAANELRITRYEDEVAVDHVRRSVSTEAVVLTAHPGGAPVATLKRERGVIQLAERNGFYLVTFDGEGSTLLGWIVKYAFEDLDAGAPGTKLPGPWCSGTKVNVFQGSGPPRCGYVCYRDFECAENGGSCEAALELEKSGEVPAPPRYTTVCTGGTETTKDAGAPSLFGEARQPNGKCRTGTTEVKKIGSSLCFMACKQDSECPEDARCKPITGATEKVCWAN